jgi:L-amino acid N-acyltransferase YncA
VSALVERIRESYWTGGVIGVSRGALRWVCSPALRYEKQVVLDRRLEEAADVGPTRVDGVTIRLGDVSDLEAMAETGRILWSEHLRLRAKLDAGQDLIVVAARAVIAGYAFVDRHRWRVGGLELPLPPETTYNDSNFVFPEWRGRGLQQAMLGFVSTLSAELGCRRCVALVLAHNRASLRAHRRAGFREIGRIRVVTLMNRWRSVIFRCDLPTVFRMEPR